MPAPAVIESPETGWLRDVYRPGELQLTVRAALSGMVIGAVMCLANLYVVLKTGWSVGVTVTACILAYATFGVLRTLRISRKPFGPLENNAMGSVASAAGYMTGGGNMAAVPALLMLTGALPSSGWLIAWLAGIAILGVCAAIPIKRQLINHEGLAFPTGAATAETIRVLHGHGDAAKSQTRLLGGAGLVGGLVSGLRGLHFIPDAFGLPFTVGGLPALKWTLALEGSVMMLGAGALMSFRTGWSLLLGSVATFGFLAPAMVAAGVIKEAGFKPIVQWSLWTGAAILVSSGLMSFAIEWKSVLRSFRELGRLFGKRTGAADPMDAVECPGWWFPAGFAIVGPIVVFLAAHLFGIPWWAGVLALPMSVLMGIVAARVTGETDVTPTKALGPVTQLTFGAILPGNVTANVMGANITGGVGLHAADLLTDLKSGWLLGANPRQQFVGQLFGCVAGAVTVVPAFNLLVPTADVLGSAAFPAPAAQVWAGVSRALVEGVAALHPTARVGAAIGLVLGLVLAVLERKGPAKLRPFLPSPAGLGIAMVIPAWNAFSMFLGASIAEWLRRWHPKTAEKSVLPVSSGLIAGESLVGIAIAILVAIGVLSK